MFFNFLIKRLHPDAGTFVNAIPNTVNAYTGAVHDTRSADELKALNHEYWVEELLDTMRDEFIFTQLGDPENLPQNRGTTVNWTRVPPLPDADVLVEGVIPQGKRFSIESISVPLVQYGIYTTVTDRVQVHAIGQLQQKLTAEVGDSLGRSYDKVVRAALLQSDNVVLSDSFVKSTGVFANTNATRGVLSAEDSTFSGLSPAMVAKMVTELVKRKAKPFRDGNFIAVIHPSVMHDLRRHVEFIETHKYEASTPLWKNEIGTLSGTRFIWSNLAPIIRGAGLTAGADNLKVAAAGVSAAKVIPVKEGITVDDAAALVGRKVLIAGVQYEITAAANGDAGAATITVDENLTALENVVIYPGEAGAKGAAVYPCIFMGRDAFKVIKPDGMGIEHIAHDKGSIGGPLNQFATIGGKFETAAKIVYPDNVGILECTSSFSMIDEANYIEG